MANSEDKWVDQLHDWLMTPPTRARGESERKTMRKLTPEELEMVLQDATGTYCPGAHSIRNHIAALEADIERLDAALSFTQLERDNRTAAYKVGVKMIGELQQQLAESQKREAETGDNLAEMRDSREEFRYSAYLLHQENARLRKRAVEIMSMQYQADRARACNLFVSDLAKQALDAKEDAKEQCPCKDCVELRKLNPKV